MKRILLGVCLGVVICACPIITGCSVNEDVNVRIEEDFVQWQLEGNEEWNDLISVDEIKGLLGEAYKGDSGNDGREVEFQEVDGIIQWRYVTLDNSDDWKDLVSLAELKGDKGDKGDVGSDGLSAYQIYCSYKPNYKKSETEWLNDYISGDLLLLPSSLGDINLDGIINTVDAALIQRYSSGILSLTREELANADVDANGEITMFDSTLVQAYAVKKIDSLPVLEERGDINLDHIINDEDYSLLEKANTGKIELNDKQKLLLSFTDEDDYQAGSYDNALIILRDYLDGKIESLNCEYYFITLVPEGVEISEDNFPTHFYVKSGKTIEELPSALPNNFESFIFEGWEDESGDEITTETIIKHNYVLKPILVLSYEPQE